MEIYAAFHGNDLSIRVHECCAINRLIMRSEKEESAEYVV